MGMSTHCDAGCGQGFEIDDFSHEQSPDGVEKTYFTCPHCRREYVGFYTDEEIRKLQERIRRVQRRFADPEDNHEDAARKEAELKEQIKEKMDVLRARIEEGMNSGNVPDQEVRSQGTAIHPDPE